MKNKKPKYPGQLLNSKKHKTEGKPYYGVDPKFISNGRKIGYGSYHDHGGTDVRNSDRQVAWSIVDDKEREDWYTKNNPQHYVKGPQFVSTFSKSNPYPKYSSSEDSGESNTSRFKKASKSTNKKSKVSTKKHKSSSMMSSIIKRGGRKILKSLTGNSSYKDPKSWGSNYHQQAQTFINGSKKLGYRVSAEGDEIIASPPGTKGYKKASKKYKANSIGVLQSFKGTAVSKPFSYSRLMGSAVGQSELKQARQRMSVGLYKKNGKTKKGKK